MAQELIIFLKKHKILIMRVLSFFVGILLIFSSCNSKEENPYDKPLTMNELLHSYDLWYVNIEKTGGTARIPFLQKAFTLTFDGRNLLANNNLVGLGRVGNGFGDHIGTFSTDFRFLTISHASGLFRFEVVQVADNQIDLYDTNSNAVYRLEGFYKRNFDYDRLFYDNVIYFLQEYETWRKETTNGGTENIFDKENSLRFYSLNGDYVFESDGVNFYKGIYKIEPTRDIKTKILTLDYGRNGIEEFEFRVLSDSRIELYHLRSKTTYTFFGVGNIIYRKKITN